MASRQALVIARSNLSLAQRSKPKLHSFFLEGSNGDTWGNTATGSVILTGNRRFLRFGDMLLWTSTLVVLVVSTQEDNCTIR